jgi:hypothetical protein
VAATAPVIRRCAARVFLAALSRPAWTAGRADLCRGGSRIKRVRERWFSRRAFVLHFLLVTIVPGCLLAGWWQVHRALSGNLLSYFYSVEWPIFAVLGVVAWWQLIHDERSEVAFEGPQQARRSLMHRDDEIPTRPLVWDPALESAELRRYNEYLRALKAGGARKTWGNPRGLPLDALSSSAEPSADEE